VEQDVLEAKVLLSKMQGKVLLQEIEGTKLVWADRLRENH
jgi:hypothetical protein